MPPSEAQRRIQGVIMFARDAIGQHPVAARTLFVGLGVAATVSAYYDYQAFLALGRGGIPYNIFGWLINLLVLKPLASSYSARLYVGDFPSSGASKGIETLPMRAGNRPKADGIVPHRQMTDQASETMAAPLQQIMTAFVDDEEFSGKLEIRKSHYELHNDALYVSQKLLTSEQEKVLPATVRIAKGEITHVHPDRSVHVYLRAADARQIIEKGWGERHRLSRTWPFWLGWRQNLLGLGHTYVMIYGPRNEEELESVRTIMREGVRFMLDAERS